MWVFVYLRSKRDSIRPLFSDATFALLGGCALAAIYGSLSAAGVITMTLAIPLLLLAWLFAMSSTYFLNHLWKPTHAKRMFIALIIAAPLFLVGSYEYKNQPASSENLDLKLVLRCSGYGAPLQVDPDNPPYVLAISGSIPEPPGYPWKLIVESGYAVVASPDFRSPNSYVRTVAKCSILNHGSVAITDMMIDAKFSWHNPLESNADLLSPEEVGFRYRPFRVPSFDAEGKEANFFIVNYGPSGVVFYFSPTVLIHRAGSLKAETVRMVMFKSGSRNTLFPPRGMTTKYLPGSPPLDLRLQETPGRK